MYHNLFDTFATCQSEKDALSLPS